MMADLFTSFDFQVYDSFGSTYSYVYSSLILVMYMNNMWIHPTPQCYGFHGVSMVSINLSKPTSMMSVVGSLSFMMSILYSLMSLNFNGMIPYVPSLTAQLMNSLSMGLVLWVTLIVVGISTIKLMKSSLLPESIPMLIAPFMGLVEGTSSVIRPVTISFRLSANISAGHIILGMMSITGVLLVLSLVSLIYSILFSTWTIGYGMYEVGVCIVQAFVFTLLGFMYSSDYFKQKSPFFI